MSDFQIKLMRQNNWKELFESNDSLYVHMGWHIDFYAKDPSVIYEFIQSLAKFSSDFYFEISEYCLDDPFHKMLDEQVFYATYFTEVRRYTTYNSKYDEIIPVIKSYEVIEIRSLDTFKKLQQKFSEESFDKVINLSSSDLIMTKKSSHKLQSFNELTNICLKDIGFINVDKHIVIDDKHPSHY